MDVDKIEEVVLPEVVAVPEVVPVIVDEEEQVDKDNARFEEVILHEQVEIKHVLEQFNKSVEEQEASIISMSQEVKKLQDSILFQENDSDILKLVKAKLRVLRRFKRLMRVKLSKFHQLAQ